MATMPIQNPPVPPSEITNRPPNTDVPLSMLSIVDRATTNPYWLMAHLPARAMRAAHAAALVAGFHMDSTGRTRTYEQQRTLFLARHEVVTREVYNSLPASGGYRRIWDGKYWRLKAGMAAAAVPSYTAPHVTGCCDDLALQLDGDPGVEGVNTAFLQWAYVNMPRFGFMWSLTSEPWHVQWVCGDSVPQAVLDYEASLVPKPPTEVIPPPILEEDDMPFIIRETAGSQYAIVYGTGLVTGLDGADVPAYEKRYGEALPAGPGTWAGYVKKSDTLLGK